MYYGEVLRTIVFIIKTFCRVLSCDLYQNGLSVFHAVANLDLHFNDSISSRTNIDRCNFTFVAFGSGLIRNYT